MDSKLKVHEMDKKDQECLKVMKEKIAVDPDEKFKSSVNNLDDEFLLRFVRGRKQNVDKAFKTLKNHIYVKEVLYKDLFDRLNANEVKHVLNNPLLTSSLKSRDDKGRLVGIFTFARWDPSKVSAEEVILTWILQAEALWTDVGIQRNGMVLDCYPIRIKGMHYVDTPTIFDIVLKMNKTFLSSKLRSRLFSHHSSDCTDWSTLHQHLPPSILPDSLGGDLTPEEAFDLELNRKLLAKDNLELEF